MNYESGVEIKVGDIVQIEHGNTKGIVIEILLSKEDFQKWNMELDEPTLILDSKPFGKVAWQIKGSDPIVFEARSLHNKE